MDRRDPASKEFWDARYREACRQFKAGEFPMSADVFRATLHGLGFRGQAIEAEVALNCPENKKVTT